MNKVVVLVLADVDTKGDLGRVVNALQTAKEFKEAGDEVRLVFDGLRNAVTEGYQVISF